MKATNSNKNLKGTDRDEAASQSVMKATDLEEPVIRSDPGMELIQDFTESFFVTRSEWNDLMERIAKHNRQSPHPF